jgi:hypothetical protein
MELLGAANWWLPRGLARVLPGEAAPAADAREPALQADGQPADR